MYLICYQNIDSIFCQFCELFCAAEMHIQIDAAASARNPFRMLGNPLSDLFELPFLREGMRPIDNKYRTI